jgi:ferric-dicitrate binding protein FerR (iron transport regulator)
MKKDQFLLLLSKKLTGDITEEERKLLELTTEGNKEYTQLADKLSKYFMLQNTKNSKTEKLKRTWEVIANVKNHNFEGSFDFDEPKIQRFNWLKVAAVVVVCLSAVIVGYQLSQKNTVHSVQDFATANQKSFRVLDDGTKIWLNKNSAIIYNNEFGKEKREITLQGEAYFDVVKNSSVPLLIHVEDIDIEVKGTAFNVEAYHGKSAIQISLVHGLIQVTQQRDTTNKVLLKPNQKLIIENAETNGRRKFLVMPINSSLLSGATEWTVDTLIFHKEKLKDLVVQLEKKYEVKIEIHNARLKERRFSGKLIDETLQQALDALKLSYPLTYTINNKLVIIKD